MAPDLNKKPISKTEMARLMAVLGPFEKRPHIAVAVSGGADSLALTLLADAWARQLDGKVTALTVDHNLRAGSAGEAHQVACWLSTRGIDHRVLTWKGRKPVAGVQASARAARYELMGTWCRDAGVLHLLLAHHMEDQAETFLLRLNHGSGIDGLSAMAGVVEKADMRLLRPLLGTPKIRLRTTLEAMSQPWLEDPSNENPAFERVRIRQSFPDMEADGISAQGLSETARRMARARIALEQAASGLLAQSCHVYPTGYANLEGDALFSGAAEISLRAVSRTLMCIGGGEYPAQLKKVERLHEKMKAAYRDGTGDWKGGTLGRCRVLPVKNERGDVSFLICRESRFLPAPIAVRPALECYWDGRFHIRLDEQEIVSNQTVSLQPLGKNDWSELVADDPEICRLNVPMPVRTSLPALLDEAGVIAVPHLNYCRGGMEKPSPGFEKAIFHPKQTLSGAGFQVAQ